MFEFGGIDGRHPAREVPLPIIPAIRVELDELSHKAAQLTAVEHNISRSQARLQRNACVHPLLTKESIRLDNNRRANLKRDIDKRAAKLLYTAGIAYGARVLALEDLSSLQNGGEKRPARQNRDGDGKTAGTDCGQDPQLGCSDWTTFIHQAQWTPIIRPKSILCRADPAWAKFIGPERSGSVRYAGTRWASIIMRH